MGSALYAAWKGVSASVMSSPQGLKSTGRDYTAAEKLAVVEREIILIKKAAKRGGPPNPLAVAKIDVLRAIARDYRAPATGAPS